MTSSYRFETAQLSGLKFYRMVGQGLVSLLLQCRTASKKMEPFLRSGGYSRGTPPFRVDRDSLIGHIFGSIARRKLMLGFISRHLEAVHQVTKSVWKKFFGLKYVTVVTAYTARLPIACKKTSDAHIWSLSVLP